MDAEEDAATASMSSLSNGTSSPSSSSEVEVVELPPLQTVWQDDKVEKIERTNSSGGTRTGWKCCWCGGEFFPIHHKRVVKHLIKESGCDIRVCKAAIPDNRMKRYKDLNNQSVNHSASLKRSAEEVDTYVEEVQEQYVVLFVSCVHILCLSLYIHSCYHPNPSSYLPTLSNTELLRR